MSTWKKKSISLPTYVGNIIPLVLKKHSPLLYTEKHGTLALRNSSKAGSTPAGFAISEEKSSAKVKGTPKKKHTNRILDSGMWSYLCYLWWKDTASVQSFRSSLSAPLSFIHLFLLLLSFRLSASPPWCPSWTDALTPRGLYLYRSSTSLFFFCFFFLSAQLTFWFLCFHLSTNLPLINYRWISARTYTTRTERCTHNCPYYCSVCLSPLHCFTDNAPEYTVCTLSDNICFRGCHLTLSVDHTDDTLYRMSNQWPIV